MRVVFVRNGLQDNYDPDAVSRATGCHCREVSLTDQSGKDDADINVIVRRFGITGQLPQAFVPPSIEEFVDVFDYQSARNALVEAERRFMQMPAELRAKFENDPQKVIDFVLDPKNIEEVRRLGLAPPAAVVESPPVASPA